MKSLVFRTLVLVPVLATLVILAWPSLVADRRPNADLPPGLEFGAVIGGRVLPLGTTRDGADFVTALVLSASASSVAAIGGTLLLLIAVLLTGLRIGTSRTPQIVATADAAVLGVMTLPDITLLLTVYAALPRGAGESRITATIVALLVGMWLPPYAKLVASRVRALDNAVFVRFSKMIGAHPLHTIRKDVLPHLREDLAWVLASAFPRFLHVELGLAYVGIDYRARGLGRLLKESYEHFSGGPYALQLCIVSATVVWIALLPQLAFRTLGVSLARGHGSE